MPTRRELIDGLRELADFYTDHPGFPPPPDKLTVMVPIEDGADFQALELELGAGRRDSSNDTYAIVEQNFGGVRLELFTARVNTCERRQIGTRMVVRRRSTGFVDEPVEVPIYAWDCAGA